MPKFNVCIEINAQYECTVEAETEDEVYELAVSQCDNDIMFDRFDPLEFVCFDNCYIDEVEEEIEKYGQA